ncbi:VOC family protein [Oceanidesulfovibrio marinus]|uniref:VOC family protein n=1 Tax=Oceanidesulfovibrio marinus TaxID=370038 RepID=A0A6P1ZLS3_9BACT|nr:VOC family protein [Oceanidesulfovibrio marinus]TVM34998.1 VOC family protein [Oceanidesulfovibrio marinus]
MEQRLSMVSLGVESLERASKFYAAMGFAPAGCSDEHIVFYQLKGIALALYPRNLLAEDAQVPAEGSGFSGITLAYNVREREEADRVLAQAKAAGGTVVKPAQEVFWGGYSGYFADPDGHLWEVCWNPFFPIAEDGSIIVPESLK